MSMAFVANLQASKRVKPCNRTLDWPTRFAQTTAVRRTDFCEHRRDAAFPQALPMRLGTVASVALNDLWFMQGTPPLAPNVRNGLDQRIKLGNVVAVCAGQDDRERDALRVDDEVVFAPELAPVRGIRAGFFPASTARIDELSTSARDKSISPRRRNSASSVSWMRCQTPASCHATSRRQQAVPEPHPISCGSRFHAMPERSTNTMPVSTARSGVGLRPAYCRLRGARAGRSGSISDHSSSSMSSLGIASCQAKQDRKLTPSQKS
ncbi:hypothetical protein B0G69_1909 [Paraburkholderia sp. RAU2J]|nr:hypothetical protein B0G69_8030 [Paraburkholderia sp. RAU2J]RKT21054.1 hypothetical protein B0G69_4426 [Paraburkholderia sp. RAU2J]RKT26173.1 hypothetical protein B0G69_1909 [Paraburkholderia sp. RAU2J]